jgi:hypothetical protein
VRSGTNRTGALPDHGLSRTGMQARHLLRIIRYLAISSLSAATKNIV